MPLMIEQLDKPILSAEDRELQDTIRWAARKTEESNKRIAKILNESPLYSERFSAWLLRFFTWGS